MPPRKLTVIDLAPSEEAPTAQMGAPLEHIALVLRGECTAGVHRTTKGHLLKEM